MVSRNPVLCVSIFLMEAAFRLRWRRSSTDSGSTSCPHSPATGQIARRPISDHRPSAIRYNLVRGQLTARSEVRSRAWERSDHHPLKGQMIAWSEIRSQAGDRSDHSLARGQLTARSEVTQPGKSSELSTRHSSDHIKMLFGLSKSTFVHTDHN